MGAGVPSFWGGPGGALFPPDPTPEGNLGFCIPPQVDTTARTWDDGPYVLILKLKGKSEEPPPPAGWEISSKCWEGA